MTAAQQGLALFIGVVTVLIVASVAGYVLDRWFTKGGPNPTIDNLGRRIKA